MDPANQDKVLAHADGNPQEGAPDPAYAAFLADKLS